MMKGIDVSENNGVIDWGAVKAAGFEFAIIRLGYGNWHIDSRFYENVNGALKVGLKIGIYYYSYALSDEAAGNEADFVIKISKECGLTHDKLPMGVWFDIEDADGYKERHGVTNRQELTNMCSVFINRLWSAGYGYVGLYANYDWLKNKLFVDQLGGCAIWCAQYNSHCDYQGAHIWQYSSSENIEGNLFDANVVVSHNKED